MHYLSYKYHYDEVLAQENMSGDAFMYTLVKWVQLLHYHFSLLPPL